MEKYMILLMQDSSDKDWKNPSYIAELGDLLLCDKYGQVITFNFKESAEIYRDENSIDGQIIEVPFY